jgi:hypothetical protein
LGCNIEPYVILDVCLNTLNSGHVGFLVVLSLVMVSRLVLSGAVMKSRASCGAQHKVWCSARADIEVASHDPSWNCTNMLSSRDHFLRYLFLFVGRSYIKSGHLCYVRLEPRWFGCNLLDPFVLYACEPLINSICVVDKPRY